MPLCFGGSFVKGLRVSTSFRHLHGVSWRSYDGGDEISLMVWTEEEEFLVGFFEEDYVRYRRRTRVWIPFIP